MAYRAWNKAAPEVKRRYFELIRQGAPVARCGGCVAELRVVVIH
jgi:hypothetical protein